MGNKNWTSRWALSRWMLCGILILTSGLFQTAFGEGTKQIQPQSSVSIRFQIFDNGDVNRDFMSYIADTASRLHIRISDVNTEVIHFGFRQDNGDVYFRLRDPLGNIVYTPQLVPSSGSGYISSYNEAVAGPDIIDATNGYSSLSYTPSIAGDYYIEFNRGDADNYISGTSNVKRTFRFFDVTVVDITDSTAIEGRLWSQAWDFNCMSGSNPFEAEMHIYAEDSILTSIDFNGIQPFGFVIYANSSGPANTGNVVSDRQSVTGQVTEFAEHQLFIQLPDTNVFEPTKRTPQFGSPSEITGCQAKGFDIGVNATHKGVVEVFIDMNGNTVYDAGTADVFFIQNIDIGDNSIPWDGLDGLGTPVPDATTINLYFQYFAGLTHLPLYDVENHTNGFIVNTIAPATSVEDVFWDDSNISGGTVNTVAPCNGACHTWGNTQGNVNTINTWWVTNYDYDTVAFTLYYDCTPEPVNDTVTTAFNTAIVVDVQANDVEPDADALTTSIVSGPANGSAILVGNSIQYTPNNGYTGPDTIRYEVCDDASPAPALCDTAFIFITVECDDDGISSPFENADDADGDGISNQCDLDSDNDGVTDAVEGAGDSDGDGIPDFLDLDSDNDGIPDAIEANGGSAPTGYSSSTGRITGSDGDGDGLLDAVDNAPATAYGGSSTSNLGDANTDGDAVPNRIDRDSDADGITDLVEVGGSDANNDGAQDGFIDADQNGLHDALLSSPYTLANTDGTGLPNFLDRDSDGDGISDNREGQTTAGFTAIGAATDSDGDGIIDQYDVNSGNAPITPTDTDSDGTPDYLDSDSDNDTVPDLIEGNDGNMDGTADSNASGADSDGDGLDDNFDSDNGSTFGGYTNYGLQNTDSDAEPDWRDSDDDADGIATSSETGDVNSNTTPDYLEAAVCPQGFTLQTGTVSGNGDAVFSQTGVTNPNNALNAADGAYAEIRNGDNIVIDLTDIIPSGETVVLTLARIQTNGALAGADIEQSLDGSAFSNTQSYTSSVSQPTFESFNYPVTGSGARYIRVTRTARGVALDALSYSYVGQSCDADTDMDGIANTVDVDDDNDGILDVNEGSGDFDGDGIPNDQDLDSDNDGIPDAVEANNGNLPANMNEQGQYPNAYALANDSDGDGWVNDVDTSTGGTALADSNNDGDANPNRLDLDSDDDGLLDAVEANDGSLPPNMDNNGQYPVAYATSNDTDGDGLIDDVDPDNGGTLLVNPDNDNDTVKDFLDQDSDADGINDGPEGFDPDVNASGVDTDGDGLDDAFDPDCAPCGAITGTTANLPDEDGDGRPDYLDFCLTSVQAGPWNDPNTWGGSVPDSFTCVVVQHAVTLGSTGFAYSVTIESSGSINTSTSQTLKVYGDLTNNSGSVSGSGTICMCGNTAQTLYGTLTVPNLTVDNSSNVRLDNAASISVSTSITLTEGNLDNSAGGTLTLEGNTSGTAYTSGSGTGNFVGDVTIQQYIGGCAGFLTLGAPFATTYAAYQNLYIQGCTGCQSPTDWQNTYTYNETTAGTSDLGYEGVDNISNNIAKGVGFLTYQWATTVGSTIEIAGEYSMDAFTFPISYTTTAAGNLHDGFNLVANPYPATIDWSSSTGWTKTGLCDAIYTYNRCQEQYSSYVSGISVNGGTRYISPLAGFWVKAHQSSNTLQINRNAISDGVQQDFYSQPQLSVLKVKMDAYGYTDEAAISFGDTASSNGLGSWYGAAKVITEAPYYPSVYTVQEHPYDTFDMSINMMVALEEERIVQLKTMAGFYSNYTYTFSGMEEFDPDICILLEDSVTGTWTNLRVDSTITVLLDSTGIPDTRFRIHFTRPVEIEETNPSCPGGDNGWAAAAVKPGALAQFTWTDLNGQVVQTSNGAVPSDTLKGLPAGNYYVTILDTNSPWCGEATRLVSLYDPAPITAQFGVTDASWCKTEDGSIAVSQVQGGTPPYAYYWSNGDTAQNLNQVGGGNYMLWISDSNGCEQTFLNQVNSPAVISSHFSMSTDTLDLSQGNTVSFTNQSVNAQNYEWDFDDGGLLSTVANPVHAFSQTGLYVVNLDATSAGCQSTFSQVLEVVNTVSVDEVEAEPTIVRVWPNPTTGTLFLDFSKPFGSEIHIRLVDLRGRTLWERSEVPRPGTPFEINLQQYSNGIYLLQVESGGQRFDQKISVIGQGN